jgi:hypothetical protein
LNIITKEKGKKSLNSGECGLKICVREKCKLRFIGFIRLWD